MSHLHGSRNLGEGGTKIRVQIQYCRGWAYRRFYDELVGILTQSRDHLDLILPFLARISEAGVPDPPRGLSRHWGSRKHWQLQCIPEWSARSCQEGRAGQDRDRGREGADQGPHSETHAEGVEMQWVSGSVRNDDERTLIWYSLAFLRYSSLTFILHLIFVEIDILTVLVILNTSENSCFTL